MFDLDGNVIGINSALISPTGASVGIGLAIPAELAKPVIDSLRRGQRPQRGYLGVGLQPLDENIAGSLGLPKDSGEIVRSVSAGRARRQGRDPAGRRHRQRQPPAGHARPDGVLHHRQHHGRVARSGRAHPRRPPPDGHRDRRPAPDRGSSSPRSAAAAPMTATMADGAPGRAGAAGARPVAAAADAVDRHARSTCRRRARGVVITAVDPNSDAADKGLQRGFLIMSVNRAGR